MYYDFIPAKGGFVLAKKELLFVPEFKDLYDGFGWNAIQYLFYFSSPLSPYFSMVEEQRDRQIKQAVEDDPWESGRKLPPKLYQQPAFKVAAKKLAELDDALEAKQEAILHNLRRDTMEHIGTLDIKKTDDRKQLVDLLDTLDTLSKQHRENKKALAERLAADDGVAVTVHDL